MIQIAGRNLNARSFADLQIMEGVSARAVLTDGHLRHSDRIGKCFALQDSSRRRSSARLFLSAARREILYRDERSSSVSVGSSAFKNS